MGGGGHVGLPLGIAFASRDLDVTRHVFRGEPAYVVRDPLTLQSHRLNPADYAIVKSIKNNDLLLSNALFNNSVTFSRINLYYKKRGLLGPLS